jgi:chromosome segregation ATPase
VQTGVNPRKKPNARAWCLDCKASTRVSITYLPMTSAARANAVTTGSPAAIAQHLAQTTDDLERLRASLDAKLAKLEAALAGTDDSEPLETLVIDLARVATREADAAATHGCLEAERAAQQVAEARAETKRAIEAQREAVQELREQLETANATAEEEREAAATLKCEADALREAVQSGRASEKALRLEIEQTEQRLFVVETLKKRELEELRDQIGLQYASERADTAALEQTLKGLQAELAAARETGETNRRHLEASLELIDGAERRINEVERARQESEGRAEAARLEAVALADQLREAREAADQQVAAIHFLEARLDAAEQQAVEQARQHREASDAFVEAARLEAADLANQLRAAREAADGQAAAAQALEARLGDADRLAAERERQHREAFETLAQSSGRDATALADELRAAREATDQRVAALHAMQAQLASTEREAAQQHRLHREAAEALAEATRVQTELIAELEAARAAASVAAELRVQLEAVDAERTTVALVLQDSESGLEVVARERDTITAELELARRDAQAAGAAVAAAETRYEDLRESSAARIRELERALLEIRSRPVSTALTVVGDDDEEEEIEDDLGAQLWDDDEQEAIEIGAATTSAEAPSLIPPTRRTERQLVPGDVEVQIDDLPAILVDLSVNGAQILSPTALKPNRAVTLLLPVGERAVLCKGKVVWARLEASSEALRYRGGIFFTHVEQRAIEAFLAGDMSYQPKSGQSAQAANGQSLSGEPATERHSEPARAAGSAR